MSGGYGSAASVRVLCFLPAHGDGHFLGTGSGTRAIDLAYFGQLAQATDSLGYYGVLVPTGKSCEDSWLVAAAMVPLTRRLRFLWRYGRICSRRRWQRGWRPPSTGSPTGAR